MTDDQNEVFYTSLAELFGQLMGPAVDLAGFDEDDAASDALADLCEADHDFQRWLVHDVLVRSGRPEGTNQHLGGRARSSSVGGRSVLTC